MRNLMTTIAVLTICLATNMANAAQPRVTRILIDKSERWLEVHAGEQVLARYRIALGGNPLGHKQQEGDRRTPEGRYMLDYTNPKSAYYRSIHISYPNRADRERARARGRSPGGDIMIHGQPNNADLARRVLEAPGVDWTDGCIALSNADMKALWDIVRVPTPIEIVP